MTAFWLFLFWVFRGGRFAKFISEPVLGGCVSGIATVVILTQIPRLFGGASRSGRAPALLSHLIGQLPQFHPLSALLGVGTIAVILIGRRWIKMSLSVVMMAVGILLSAVFHLDRYGVELVGAIPAGLPQLTTFNFAVFMHHSEAIVIDTLAIALVVAAETLVSTLEVARKYDDEIDNQRELLAYAMGNLAAAAVGSSPVSGSISRTRRAGYLKVGSQWMSVSACVVLGLFLLFGTPLLAYLPVPILTGIVIASLITMIEFPMAVHLWKLDRSKFFVFLAAFGAELLGLAEGVIVGVVLSFASFTMRASDQPRYFLGCLKGKGGFYDLGQTPHARPIEHTVVYQFNGTLFFASVEDFESDILGALEEDTKLVVVTGVAAVDVSAAERLLEFYHRLKARGIAFYLAGHASAVNEELIKYGAEELVRDGAVCQRLTQALAAGGLEPPYPLRDAVESTTPAAGSVALEDFNWAYGKYAPKQIERLAHHIAVDILHDGVIDETHLNPVERAVADEYWNEIDEVDFQKLLSFAQEIAAGTRAEDDAEFRALGRQLLGRRIRLELNLYMRGDEAAAIEFARLRLHLESTFIREYPEAGALMLQMRLDYLDELQQLDPTLSRLVRQVNNLADDQ